MTPPSLRQWRGRRRFSVFVCVARLRARKETRMSTKKWVILIAMGMAVCVTMVAIVIIVWFFGLGNVGADGWLPVRSIEQTASVHPGFLRTTVTSGTSVF